MSNQQNVTTMAEHKPFTLPAPMDASFDAADVAENLEGLLLHDLMSAANSEQRRLVRSRLQGRSMAEAALAQDMSVKQARRLLNELRRTYSETERRFNIHEF